MAVEANALTVLQEGEAQATEDDLRNVWNELAKERADAESTLKNQLKVSWGDRRQNEVKLLLS